MGHLVPGGTETGQNEDYQMSTILRNGTIAPKNSQYPSVQENTDPQSDAIINLIPTTGTQVHGPMLSPQVQWASCRPGQRDGTTTEGQEDEATAEEAWKAKHPIA